MTRRKSKRVAAIAAGFGVLPLSAAAQGQPSPDGYGYGPQMMGWGDGWHGMIFGPLFMIVILALVVGIVILLVRWLGPPWHGPGSRNYHRPAHDPIDILRERFARGEIDKEEFEERRRVLGE